MSSEDEIDRENLNRPNHNDVIVSLVRPNSLPPDRNLRIEVDTVEYSNGSNRQSEDQNCFILLKQQIYSYFTIFKDWWICTSVIKKVKLLGFVFLPCLAVALYIFHYIQNPSSLHNPIAVLHPLSVVHPVIPSPFHSTVKFIEEKSKDLLGIPESADVPLTTKKGPIVGRRFDPNPATGASYDAFLGIPYGHVPTRFQRAAPASSWTSPRTVQSDGPPCPQAGVDFSEDCLFINVFTPKGASSATAGYPVIAFIHDSSFTWGSSSSKDYGPDFLVPKGVILVTFNYRLGAVGFLTLGSQESAGNMGLYDTQLALHWIQDEIHNFGGNAGKVTLMGQGSGSILALYHYLSPSSAGFFRYVIAQSGSALAGWGHYSPSEGTTRAKALAAAVGCDSSANNTQLMACLRQTNISYIVGNQSLTLATHYEASGQTAVFLPVLDTDFSNKPFFNDSLSNLLDRTANRSKPLILGFTADEGIAKFAEETSWKIVEANLDAFIPTNVASSLSESRKAVLVDSIRRRYFLDSVTNNKVLDIIKIFEDNMVIYPILQVARKLANSSYGYVFDFKGPWTPDPPFIAKLQVSGVNQGFDLRYLFYSPNTPQDLGNCSSLRESLKVRDMMVNWWTNFVKSGTPGDNWPKISGGGYLKITPNVSLINATTMEIDHNFSFWASLESGGGDISSAIISKLNVLMVIFVSFLSVMITTLPLRY